MIHDGKMSRDDLVDIGAVAAGETIGRRGDEIIIFGIGGMPVGRMSRGGRRSTGNALARESVRH